ncbi:MAG: hypothetical protein CH6_0243 [Candidatus Kapaibacterium sp.]|nr:MAG: hypothetical protein CH6_0243 [Candidatus Kapabacteria bacterium]
MLKSEKIQKNIEVIQSQIQKEIEGLILRESQIQNQIDTAKRKGFLTPYEITIYADFQANQKQLKQRHIDCLRALIKREKSELRRAKEKEQKSIKEISTLLTEYNQQIEKMNGLIKEFTTQREALQVIYEKIINILMDIDADVSEVNAIHQKNQGFKVENLTKIEKV